jgi:hypothetical protein
VASWSPHLGIPIAVRLARWVMLSEAVRNLHASPQCNPRLVLEQPPIFSPFHNLDQCGVVWWL